MNFQEAIKEITYKTKKLPKEAFEVVEANPEEAKPYLYDALDKAIREGKNLEEGYQLHFYSIFLLAEFQDKEAFGKLMELASLPPETLDYLIGDATTEGLKDGLYLTYNGNKDQLVQCIKEDAIDEYARGAMLNALGQLYLDGTLARDEWQEILRGLIYTEGLGEYLYAKLAGMVCECHLIELMEDMDYLFGEGLVEERIFGDYDSCVDRMFDYSREHTFCRSSLVASRVLEGWAMFEQEEKTKSKVKDKDFDKFLKKLAGKSAPKPVSKVKVGRNDPCPCGSGKKYKRCCMNKSEVQEEQPIEMESEEERLRWLARYPETGGQREAGRIYLEDYFDRESIEIDQIIYLALKHRPIPIWEREPAEVVDFRKRTYLWEAFSRWTAKMEAEGIRSIEEYDRTCSIHYKCYQWMGALSDLLERNGDQERQALVDEKYKEYGKQEM